MMAKPCFMGYKQKDIFTKCGKMHKKSKINFSRGDCGSTTGYVQNKTRKAF